MTKSRNRKLIRVTSSNESLKHICVDLCDYNIYFNQIWPWTQIPHYQHAEIAKFTKTENPRWWQPPSWISENVNNSELDRAICTKFGGQMRHGRAEMTHDQNSKPELFLRDVIIMMNKDVGYRPILNECREHNRCDDVKAYKSSQLKQIFSLSLCRTHLFALLSR